MKEEIFLDILQQIADKLNSKPIEINVKDVKYDPIVFDHLKYLYDNKYFTAELIKEESGDIVRINPITLLPIGRQYLKELKAKT